LCLNCGHAYAARTQEEACSACGLPRHACPAALGFPDPPSDPIAAAREFMKGGLFRRAIGILNHALQDRPELLEAWFLKSRFLNSIGFNRAAAEMLEGALAKTSTVADQIWLLEEQSFVWAEAENGEAALRSAEAASSPGSSSIRTHYLRGRALALLGRLEEARDEMKKVLSLDPVNADAQRALAMIEPALTPNSSKRWWQFWR
jgi:tetratricopeptide (TPR) repeat protein